MPAGRMYRQKRRRLPATPRGGLNQTEKKQTARIAKRVLSIRTEQKERNWLYPKTTYSELEHNVPFFLFGGSQTANGLLPLSKGNDSIYHPNGAALPGTAPGACREGQQVRLKALTHNCILSGDNANKNTMVRMILFSYASNQPHSVDDILLQPTGTGEGQGWPTIFLHKNTYNNKGIKFIMDRTYQVNGATSGAVADAGTGEETNWGLAGVKTFSFNYIPKGGKTIKYVETPQGADSPYPTIDYGMLIIPYGSGVTVQGEGCGRFEMLGSMKFTDL